MPAARPAPRGGLCHFREATINVSVEINVGLFKAEVTVVDTGVDGINHAVERCADLVSQFVGTEACGAAASSLWVEE